MGAAVLWPFLPRNLPVSPEFEAMMPKGREKYVKILCMDGFRNRQEFNDWIRNLENWCQNNDFEPPKYRQSGASGRNLLVEFEITPRGYVAKSLWAEGNTYA